MSQEGILNVPNSYPQIPTQFVTENGTAVPALNTLNLFAGSNMTSTGSGNTVTYSLTGLTNHDVLVGNNGTAITPVAPSATTGVPLVSNGSSSDPSFSTALIAGGGTASTSFNINGAVYSNTTTTGALQAATLTSGELLIGGTGAPSAATLTAGTGISITNGNNSITIASSGGGLMWIDVTGSTQSMAINTGYTSNDGATMITFTLPSTCPYGDMVAVVGKASGLWQIAQNSGQTIHFGSKNTTTGTSGYLQSTNQYDVVFLLCTIANTDFTVTQSIGNILVN